MASIYHARSQYMFLFSESSQKCIHTRKQTYRLAWDARLHSGFESFRRRKEFRMIKIGDKRSRCYDKNSLYRCFIVMLKAFRTISSKASASQWLHAGGHTESRDCQLIRRFFKAVCFEGHRSARRTGPLVSKNKTTVLGLYTQNCFTSSISFFQIFQTMQIACSIKAKNQIV